MIVDNLKSCYTTQMRVRLNPELIATVRWYFAPPGAKPLPTPSAFASMVWDTDWFTGDLGDLGETSLARTWDAGVAPPGVTGQSTPTPLSWYLDGVPASVTQSYPNPPCVIPRWFDLWAWLRPQSLPVGQPAGTALASWPDSSPYNLPWMQTLIAGVLQPSLVQDGADPRCGLPYVVFNPVRSLNENSALWRNNNGNTSVAGLQFTSFLVAKLNTVDPYGSLVLGSNAPLITPAAGVLNGFYCNIGIPSANDPTAQPAGWHVWAVRSSATAVELWRDGVKVASGGPSQGGFVLGGVGGNYSLFGLDKKSFWLSELLIYQVALTDAELAYAFAYLKPFICPPPAPEEDVLIGAIIMDSGTDALPAKYLLCNGQAVSRTTYSALFARVGTTYGAGDGSTTFNLPNLLGKILYGSGGSYTTGQALGADAPTLAANQLPAHSHPVTDPGHSHGPPQSGVDWIYTVFAQGTMQQPGAGTTLKTGGPTGTSTTGITVGNNTPAGSPLDVRQSGIAVRPLIYAGV